MTKDTHTKEVSHVLPYLIAVLVVVVLAMFFLVTLRRSRRKGSILVTNIGENGEARR